MKNLLLAAHCAKAVYDYDVPDWLEVIGFERILDESTDTQAMAYILEDKLVFAFRGSESKQDWLNDFKIIKKDCYGWLPAHKGFSECAEAVFPKCHEIFKRHVGKGTEIIFTGHSLGGAIAVLVAIGIQAACLTRELRQSIELVTFGQPRVGDGKLIRAMFTGPYLRVQNGSDAVCRHPWLGYSHAGTCLYLKNGRGYSVDPSQLEMSLDRIFAWQHQRATDHRMTDYLRELQKVQS